MSDLERQPSAICAKELAVRFLASIGLQGFNRNNGSLSPNLLMEGELPKIQVPIDAGDKLLRTMRRRGDFEEFRVI